MNYISELLWRRSFHCVLLCSSILYVIFVFLPVPYKDHDTLIYALIGKAIYSDGILPYDYAFDHKPFLTYFMYGPLAFFEGPQNIFAIFSLVCLIIISKIIHVVFLSRSMPFLLILFIMSVATIWNVSYSGNTEIVYISLQFLSLGFALRSKDQPTKLIASAAFAVAAVNVNYIAGIPLAPALLFCLYSTSGSFREFITRSFIYFAGSVCIYLAMVALLALAGADIGNYFSMQFKFLSGYSGTVQIPSMEFVVLTLGPVSVLAVALLIPVVKVVPQHKILCKTLLVFISFSFFSFAISGKYFTHYAFTITAPVSVVFLTLKYSQIWMRALFSVILIFAASSQFILTYKLSKFYYNQVDLRTYYSLLAREVKKYPIMSMNASIVPLYYAKLQPFHPLVWKNHPNIIFGEETDQYYTELLTQKPVFVMTNNSWCNNDGSSWIACVTLKDRYSEVQTMEDKWPAVGYSLYKLNHSPP